MRTFNTEFLLSVILGFEILPVWGDKIQVPADWDESSDVPDFMSRVQELYTFMTGDEIEWLESLLAARICCKPMLAQQVPALNDAKMRSEHERLLRKLNVVEGSRSGVVPVPNMDVRSSWLDMQVARLGTTFEISPVSDADKKRLRRNLRRAFRS